MLQNTEIKISFGIEGYSSTSHYLSSERRRGEGFLGNRVVFRGRDGRISLRQRSIKYAQKKIGCKWTVNEGWDSGGVGQRGEEIIRTLQSLVGRSPKFYRGTTKIMWTPLPPPSPPPSDIMTGPLARKPRSSNDTTPYMFIYWLVNFFFFLLQLRMLNRIFLKVT